MKKEKPEEIFFRLSDKSFLRFNQSLLKGRSARWRARSVSYTHLDVYKRQLEDNDDVQNVWHNWDAPDSDNGED